jgi:hypothetical protein
MIARAHKLRRQDGQVALETMIVLIPWLIVSTIFFNLLFLLASMMLNQSTINRGVQQTASLGCMPAQLRSDLESRTGLGLHDLRLVALTPQVNQGQRITVWDRANYFDSDGEAVARPGVARYLPDCSDPNGTGTAPGNVESGNYVLVQATYKQRLWVLGGLQMLGLTDDDSIELKTEALAVSNALEGER